VTSTVYLLGGLSVVAVLQLIATAVLLRRRRDLDLTRLEGRLSHFAEALALLTDTTQSGFASVAAELERPGRRRAPSTSRAATSRRIVSAVQTGRSVQDIAADEHVSESEIRLHLGLAEDLLTVAAATAGEGAWETAPVAATAHDRPAKARRRAASGNAARAGA
jgi:hypothetical protein